MEIISKNDKTHLAIPQPQEFGVSRTIRSFLENIDSEGTRKVYGGVLREFASFLDGQGLQHIAQLDRELIIGYKNSLKGQANKTVLRKLSAVSRLCKFLAEKGLVASDITYGVSRPRDKNVIETAALKDPDVKKIFEGLNPKRKSYFQHRAFLAIGFYTGLRSSEIRMLRLGSLGEVDGHRIIRATIKGGYDHEVPITPFVTRAIWEHIENCKSLGFEMTPDHPLFFSLERKGWEDSVPKPLTPYAVHHIFKSALKNAGIKKEDFRRYSPHSMRATIATHLLDSQDVPLEHVQKMLGHRNPSTTQKYNKREASHDKSAIYRVTY